MRSPHLLQNAWLAPLATAAWLAMGTPAGAAPLDTGIDGLSMNWDTTLKYSNAVRVEKQDPALTIDPNQDDGDRNFTRGLISNRLDLLSELTAKTGPWGLRISAAGWYDTVYNRDSAPASTSRSTADGNLTAGGFSRTTRDLHGRKAELLDAFVAADLAATGLEGTVRWGRHAQVWGESLFYGSNAIAGAMTPVDAVKLISVPGTQFKEALLPVPQISTQVQLGADASLAAYYQFRWRKTRLPAAGSYFSVGDAFFDGADFLIPTIPNDPNFTRPPAPTVPRESDLEPRNGGQAGLALRLRALDSDFGAYLVRFHDKAPQPVVTLAAVNTPGGVVVAPSSYRVAYHQGITALGASVSHTVGNWNLAGEASVRHGQPLGASKPAVLTPYDNDGNAPYALARTGHVNLNALASLGPGALWADASLVVEAAWNRVLSVQRNPEVVNPLAERDGFAMTVAFTPTWFQVTPGLDLDAPLVLAWSPKGSRSAFWGPSQVTDGGSLSAGLAGRYLDAWRFSLNFTHYVGRAQLAQDHLGRFTFGQSMADRDHVSFSLQRSF